MRRWTSEEGGHWRGLLDVLWQESGYEDRLDAALRYVRTLTNLPACHLYLAAEDGRHLHLERSQGAAASETEPADPAEPFLAGREELTGGAATIMPSPRLELELAPEDERERLVVTPAGPLYSVPLRQNGALVGLLQAGPLSEGGPRRQVQKRLEAIRHPLAVVVQQARTEESLRRELESVSARAEVGRKLQGSALEVERFVALLLSLALRATRTEAGFVTTADAESGHERVRVQVNMPPAFADDIDLSAETGLFDWSPSDGALTLRDVDAAGRLGIRSILAVPLLAGEERLGIFALADLGAGSAFDEHSLALLETFAEQARLMLDNDRLLHTFADRYLDTVRGLAASLDARRPYTQGHHEKVTRIALALAGRLGLADDEVEAIQIAAETHDVGLAGVAEGEGAYRADIEHPTVGAGLVENLPLHPLVSASIATHHEWLSGWGFPRGLRGDEITIGGRVLAAAEFIVEMSTDDPVHRAWSRERLADELERRRGSQFDPEIADAARSMLSEADLEL